MIRFERYTPERMRGGSVWCAVGGYGGASCERRVDQKHVFILRMFGMTKIQWWRCVMRNALNKKLVPGGRGRRTRAL